MTDVLLSFHVQVKRSILLFLDPPVAPQPPAWLDLMQPIPLSLFVTHPNIISTINMYIHAGVGAHLS